MTDEERKVRLKAYHKSYKKKDTNKLGEPKSKIRKMSREYLHFALKHPSIKGYEIHHCFGYDDFSKFCYIPKKLHLQIHKFLRYNKIDADSNHFNKIVHLINDWDGYTYIKV